MARTRDFRLEHNLFDVAVEFEALGRRATRAALSDGLLEGDVRVLFALLQRNQSQAELSRALAMDTGQMTRTVSRLRRKGLVEDPRDGGQGRRGYSVKLSDAGRCAAISARNRQMAAIQTFLEETDDAHLARLTTACKRVVDQYHYDIPQGPFVRESKAGDAGVVLHLTTKTLGDGFFGDFNNEVERYTAEAYLDLHRARQNDTGLFLVAERWGVVAGGLIAVWDKGDSTGRITLLIVASPYIGHGIGWALLQEALKRMRKAGCRACTAIGIRDMHGGSFFEHLGWTRIGQTRTSTYGQSRVLEEWELKEIPPQGRETKS